MTYHLTHPYSDDPYCEAVGGKVVETWADLPAGGEPCRKCLKRFHEVPFGQACPEHLITEAKQCSTNAKTNKAVPAQSGG